ncbi:MAG: signal recognition particle-docking protein FtsY [Chlamydiales bacterium]|nr:signal recognition particle-docking protein FtsY [Chlamydiales bacterium]
MLGLFRSGLSKIGEALSKTRALFGDKLRSLFKGPLSEEKLEELEQLLYEADLGSTLSLQFTQQLSSFAKKNPSSSSEDFLKEMQAVATEILAKPPASHPKTVPVGSPKMVLIVGVNGSGKTTTTAKLAHLYQKEGKKVLLAAGDTFRAAGSKQLDTWASILKIDCVKGGDKGDPSSVIFDALTAGKARGVDIVLADTAGRLQSKTDLMQELSKIKRVSEKVVEYAPHETLLVLDATTGQNGIDQARTFHSFTPLTGLILTKLDGSAKGGIILSIYQELRIPVLYVGVGEKIDDLLPFDAESYIKALFT